MTAASASFFHHIRTYRGRDIHIETWCGEAEPRGTDPRMRLGYAAQVALSDSMAVPGVSGTGPTMYAAIDDLISALDAADWEPPEPAPLDLEMAVLFAVPPDLRSAAQMVSAAMGATAAKPIWDAIGQMVALRKALSDRTHAAVTAKTRIRDLLAANSNLANTVEEQSQAAPAFDLIAHLRRQRAFSYRTFGPGARTKGVVDHIRKELAGIVAAPSDITEWVDVIILAFDGAWRAGWQPEDIVRALTEKQPRNEQRQWPGWRTADPDKAIEHVRGKPANGGEA